jgi:hypothetical protein
MLCVVRLEVIDGVQGQAAQARRLGEEDIWVTWDPMVMPKR